MRLLVNENMACPVIRALRQRGHDVLSAKESMVGQSDEAILERATRENRLLLTHDKDFGELAFHAWLSASSGIILFRLEGLDRDTTTRGILEVLDSRNDWDGQFAVVTETRIRVRPLPS